MYTRDTRMVGSVRCGRLLREGVPFAVVRRGDVLQRRHEQIGLVKVEQDGRGWGTTRERGREEESGRNDKERA
jgi:hypothetical protein